MRELGSALLRCSLGLSLVGLQQVGGAFGVRPGVRSGGSRAVLDDLSLAASGQLGDVLVSVFESVDQLQREMVDRAFDLCTFEAILRGDPLEAAAEMVAGGWESGRLLLQGPEGRLAWLEMVHKLRVYWLVRGMEGKVPAAVHGTPDWGGRVAAAYRLAPYETLFALERIGHRVASAELATGAAVGLRGLEADLPPESLILLHAGMGMALACHLVQPMPASAAPAVYERAVRRFLDLCREGSVPGYAAAAIEPLGLVVRTFAPRQLRRLDRQLRRLDPEAARYLWHGAGRALYFLPVNFFPCRGALDRALALCRAEAPDEAARRDALDGLFYALAMVNLGQPAVVEMLLAAAACELDDPAPIASGISAALLVRHLTTPADPAIPAFLAHQPAGRGGDGGLWRRDLWERVVRRPCAAALDRLRPALIAGRRFAELARHRTAAEVAA
jgi:hypothetical protein